MTLSWLPLREKALRLGQESRDDNRSPKLLGDREGLCRHLDRLSLWEQVLSALPYQGFQVWVQTGLEGVVVRKGKSSVGKFYQGKVYKKCASMCLCARTSTLADLINDASPLQTGFTCLHCESYSHAVRKKHEEMSTEYHQKKKKDNKDDT